MVPKGTQELLRVTQEGKDPQVILDRMAPKGQYKGGQGGKVRLENQDLRGRTVYRAPGVVLVLQGNGGTDICRVTKVIKVTRVIKAIKVFRVIEVIRVIRVVSLA